MTRKLDRVRVFFDSDRRRINIAFIGIAGLAVGGFYLNARTNQAQLKATKVEAIREAETLTTYQTCLASIPEFHRLSRHVKGVNDLAETLVLNSVAAMKAAPPGDPLAAARVANLRRLKVAAAEIAAVTAFPAQTVAECAARRDALEHG